MEDGGAGAGSVGRAVPGHRDEDEAEPDSHLQGHS